MFSFKTGDILLRMIHSQIAGRRIKKFSSHMRNTPRKRRAYASMVSYMDLGIGKVWYHYLYYTVILSYKERENIKNSSTFSKICRSLSHNKFVENSFGEVAQYLRGPLCTT